jgi:hypothetical protein
MNGIASDGRVDSTPGLDEAPDERDVFLLNLAIVKLAREFGVAGVVLGNHHQARGPSIETVDDAGAPLAPNPAQVVDMVQERIDQGSVCVTGGRMHDHTGCFVDDNQVAVFVHDINRQCLRRRLGVFWRRNLDENSIAVANRRVRSRRPPIEPYQAVLDQALNLRS